MRPRYRHWFDLWTDHPQQALTLAQTPGIRRVCELGGGANPLIPLEVIERQELDHEVADVSVEELAKAPAGYRTVALDATSDALARRGPYDLVVSAFLAEHVADARALHRSVYAALRPGGTALHTFPTLYEPAFVLNRLMPEAVMEPLLRRVQRGREPEGEHAKFRAYYRWCRGPSKRQLRRLRASASRCSTTSATSGMATSARSSHLTAWSRHCHTRSCGARFRRSRATRR